MAEENKQKRHLEEKICLNYKKFDNLSRQKIHSMRVQITEENGELNGELNEIRLNFEIEVKIAEEKKQKTRVQEKISRNYKKFSYFTREN